MSPTEKVRQFLDTEITNGFTVFDDASWLAAQVLWAQAAARCGHRPGSEMLYERLLPWGDQFATTHVTANGGVSHYLGMLAHTLGLHDEADRWFAKSVALHEAMETPFFVAWSQTEWASLLVDRDQPGDLPQARASGGCCASHRDGAWLRLRRTRRPGSARLAEVTVEVVEVYAGAGSQMPWYPNGTRSGSAIVATGSPPKSVASMITRSLRSSGAL